MRLIEKIRWYRREHGIRALIVRGVEVLVRAKPLKSATEVNWLPARVQQYIGAGDGGAKFTSDLIDSRFPAIRPLPVYTAPGPKIRLNLVTDSINEGSLFGGVGTAILMAAVLANKRGAVLRIVTRTQAAAANGFSQVLECGGIQFKGNVEFAFVDVNDQSAQLDICDGDRFLTTSWWTTLSVLGSISPHKVDYLLQEDERMFYPHGDEWLRCNEVMMRKDIRFMINTELLFDHLVATGLTHLEKNARWFEPAFPSSIYFKNAGYAERPKYRLFFYARPNNYRNLFYRGIEVLDKAVAKNIINPDEWEIILVGKDVPKVILAGTLEPEIIPTMEWSEYGKFIRDIDLGFCLMATPHPSYPPLDLAASGAIVLTNKFGLKQDLSMYSENILLSDLDVNELVEGLQMGVARVSDAGLRTKRYAENRMARSWSESLAAAVDFLG
ncbi:hypothetical protein [Dyella silvatica]|uniref:rhamnosyltransferase WsaF family glycosyltransferase n=1 Tax=Dyella silvatica TaxID=2992128 RepID=UPI002259382D|nr:hypothetical protein [Dyella silvatica]